jgi:divalent metal cation (Fe/Co/Zn/Cd) transporter
MSSHPWQTWATAQSIVAWLGLATAAVLAFVGVVLVVEDSSDHSDMFDGLGTGIGIAALLLAVVVAAVCEVVRRLTRRGTVRATRDGDLRLLRIAAYVALACAAVVGVGSLGLTGAVGVQWWLLLPAAAVAVPAIGLVVTTEA